MSSGIYLLEFSDFSFYIGRSDNIEKRFEQHCNYLKRDNHYNYKLQNKFNSLNSLPEVHIVELVSIKEQNAREVFWIDIFDATTEGLNISKGGDTFGCGEANFSSKNSNKSILEVFNLIVENKLSLKNISDATGVGYGVVRGIAKGVDHRWLEEVHPKEYSILLDLRNTRIVNNKGLSAKDRGIRYPSIVSPAGVVYTVDNIRQFSIKHQLSDDCLCRLLNRKVKSHKGWKVLEEE